MNIAPATIETTGPDYVAIKSKQHATWASGDYGRIGVTLQITGEELCEAVDVRAGQRVLDVAGGNGNVSLAAARRFCKVVSTDYVASLLQQSQVRARAEGLVIDYREADAENLPFDDASFDHVLSTFGVMFAPNQEQAASELARVCRPGGKIGLANWTPEGFIGQLFKTIGRYVPPPAGLSSPATWGTKEFLQRHFARRVRAIEVEPKQFNFRYQSPGHWLDVFTTYYGPTLKAFQALDEPQRQSMREDILALIEKPEEVSQAPEAVVGEDGLPRKVAKPAPEQELFLTSYYTFPDPLTTNLAGSRRFLQLSVGVSTQYDESVIKNVETHQLALRSDVLGVLSSFTEEEAGTKEGRDALALRMKDAMNKRLELLEGFGGVENVYFPSFVLQ